MINKAIEHMSVEELDVQIATFEKQKLAIAKKAEQDAIKQIKVIAKEAGLTVEITKSVRKKQRATTES